MTDHQPTKSRLELVKAGVTGDLPKRGRLLVGIDKVVEDPKNERKVFRNMEGLIGSLKAVGQIEPLTVTEEQDGTFQIITGHRRFRAAKAAGLKTVEILVREPEDERRRRRKSIVSNVQREDVGPVEMAEALRSLLEEDPEIENSQQKLADVIGKDKRWVSRILRILDLPPALQKKVALTRLSIPYDALTEVARLEDEALQRPLIDELLRGATQREIRARIKELKADSEPKTKPKQAFRTSHDAMVIVQSMTKKGLSPARCVAALEEALKQARGRK